MWPRRFPWPGTFLRNASANSFRCASGCVASTYSTCFATSSNPLARYNSPINRVTHSSNSSGASRNVAIIAICNTRAATAPVTDSRAQLRLVDQRMLKPRHPPPLWRRGRYQVRKPSSRSRSHWSGVD